METPTPEDEPQVEENQRQLWTNELLDPSTPYGRLVEISSAIAMLKPRSTNDSGTGKTKMYIDADPDQITDEMRGWLGAALQNPMTSMEELEAIKEFVGRIDAQPQSEDAD